MWDCVDFDKGTITINKQLRRDQKKGGEYYFSPPKNDKARTITPAPWIMKLLHNHSTKQIEMRLKAGELWNDTGLVFTNEIGELISYRTVYDCFKRIVATIGCPNTRFHDLRHPYVKLTTNKSSAIKQKSQTSVKIPPDFLFRNQTGFSCAPETVS